MSACLKRWSALLVSTLVLVLVTLPYLLAYRVTGGEHVFGGFLLNPLDGNTYLAKMYEGWRGDWQFTLPYTAERGQGSYLFLYYILLGHLARLLGLSLPLVFHLSRLMGAAALLYALRRYLKALLPAPGQADLAFVLAALGSGLGWAALPFGAITSDFWVAETYPFLSAYANPHFPIGLALLCWLLTPPEGGRRPPLHTQEKGSQEGGRRPPLHTLDEESRAVGADGVRPPFPWQRRSQIAHASPLEPDSHKPTPVELLLYCGAAFLLSVISPFGVVLALLVLGGTLLWDLFSIGKSRPISPCSTPALRRAGVMPLPLASRFLCVLLGGMPLSLYYLWISRADPHLAAWNAQNLTPSPPLWDVLLSLSPALLLALAGARVVIRRDLPAGRQLLVWAGLGLLLLYLPFGLQRRFMMGLFIPFSALAVLGLAGFRQAGASGGMLSGRYWHLSLSLLLFSLPTNLVVLLSTGYGARTHDPMLYLSYPEAKAFDWIESNTPEDALILASPQTGLFIPAHTGRRVIYGHPFETVNAEVEKDTVLGFFQGSIDPAAFLLAREVDYLMIGPRERSLGSPALPDGLSEVFRSGDVLIYAARPGLSKTE